MNSRLHNRQRRGSWVLWDPSRQLSWASRTGRESSRLVSCHHCHNFCSSSANIVEVKIRIRLHAWECCFQPPWQHHKMLCDLLGVFSATHSNRCYVVQHLRPNPSHCSTINCLHIEAVGWEHEDVDGEDVRELHLINNHQYSGPQMIMRIRISRIDGYLKFQISDFAPWYKCRKISKISYSTRKKNISDRKISAKNENFQKIFFLRNMTSLKTPNPEAFLIIPSELGERSKSSCHLHSLQGVEFIGIELTHKKWF